MKPRPAVTQQSPSTRILTGTLEASLFSKGGGVCEKKSQIELLAINLENNYWGLGGGILGNAEDCYVPVFKIRAPTCKAFVSALENNS